MIPDTWQHPQRLVGLTAILTAAILLGNLGGTAGIIFGVAAIGAWLAAPAVFAFVLAQAGVAAVTTPPYSLLTASVEVALLVVLLSDTTLPWTRHSRAVAVGCASILTAIIWLGQSIPTWQLTTAVLTGAALAIYGIHRYELLTTGQLNS